jgi:hypothetical protein
MRPALDPEEFSFPPAFETGFPVTATYVVADRSDVVIVADGVVGSGAAAYWKSTDGGAPFGRCCSAWSGGKPRVASSRADCKPGRDR